MGGKTECCREKKKQIFIRKNIIRYNWNVSYDNLK